MSEEKGRSNKLGKLTQIGIVVKDLDATIAKLTSYGVGPYEYRQVPDGAKEYFRGQPMDARFKIAATNLGGIELEFIQPVEGQSPHQEFLDEKGEGIQHLAFAVDNLEENVKDLTEKGASVQMNSDLGVLKVAYMDLDTSGLVFELMQMMNP